MLDRMLQLLSITCNHKKLSQPFSPAAPRQRVSRDWESIATGGQHYVVCLSCGHKFAYDWSQMRVVR